MISCHGEPPPPYRTTGESTAVYGKTYHVMNYETPLDFPPIPHDISCSKTHEDTPLQIILIIPPVNNPPMIMPFPLTFTTSYQTLRADHDAVVDRELVRRHVAEIGFRAIRRDEPGGEPSLLIHGRRDDLHVAMLHVLLVELEDLAHSILRGMEWNGGDHDVEGNGMELSFFLAESSVKTTLTIFLGKNLRTNKL